MGGLIDPEVRILVQIVYLEGEPRNTSRRARRETGKGSQAIGFITKPVTTMGNWSSSPRCALGEKVKRTPEASHPRDTAAGVFVHQFPPVIGRVLLPRLLLPSPPSLLCTGRGVLEAREGLDVKNINAGS